MARSKTSSQLLYNSEVRGVTPFIISELRCLLFGIKSIGYLIIISLSLILVLPSGYGALISFHWSSD